MSLTGDHESMEEAVSAAVRERHGKISEHISGPVTDFKTDFDHTDPAWVSDPYPIWNEIRGECPVAHTERFGGAWLPTTYEDVAAVAYDTERFTSRSILVSNNRPPMFMAPAGTAPPITSDPPFHKGARRLLLPAFAPQAVAKLEESTRAFCHGLIDEMGERSDVDAALEYSQHIPVRVMAELLGFPQEDAEMFRGFIHTVLETVNDEPASRFARLEGFFQYLGNQIEQHRLHPGDDLTSYLLDAEMDGEKLDGAHIFGTIALLLIAGVDTTWSAIGSSIWHLAKTPADRDRLVEDPTMIAAAMEEMLRAYAPVTMARLVKEDMDFNGCPMKAEDWVLLSFPSANRDPEAFDRADEVIIDREINRHAAFGLGIHRCLGSHLARLELNVALEVWLERFPTFELTDPSAVTWSSGQVRGPRSLPVTVAR